MSLYSICEIKMPYILSFANWFMLWTPHLDGADSPRSSSFRILDPPESNQSDLEPIERPRVFSLESRPSRYRLQEIKESSEADRPKTISLDSVVDFANLPLDEIEQRKMSTSPPKVDHHHRKITKTVSFDCEQLMSSQELTPSTSKLSSARKKSRSFSFFRKSNSGSAVDKLKSEHGEHLFVQCACAMCMFSAH